MTNLRFFRWPPTKIASLLDYCFHFIANTWAFPKNRGAENAVPVVVAGVLSHSTAVLPIMKPHAISL
jgi:hypothetical protein